MVQSLSIKQLEKDIEWLTGEAPESACPHCPDKFRWLS